MRDYQSTDISNIIGRRSILFYFSRYFLGGYESQGTCDSPKSCQFLLENTCHSGLPSYLVTVFSVNHGYLILFGRCSNQAKTSKATNSTHQRLSTPQLIPSHLITAVVCSAAYYTTAMLLETLLLAAGVQENTGRT